MIEVRDLAKSYAAGGSGRITVLDGLSFVAEAGGLTSVVGPSGCGKTTLLRIIAGVENPDRGEVSIQPARRDVTLSLVYQENDLLPWLTVEDNILLSLKGKKLSGEEQRAMARQCLDKVGLGEFGSFYPSRISGGMKKRASLARALAADARLILCDEPLAFLDFHARMALQELIANLFAEEERTILYVTHDLYEAVKLSTKIIVMSALPGKIKTTIEIPFPYPRDMDDLHLSREYHDIVASIKESLREEILKTDEMEKSSILRSWQR